MSRTASNAGAIRGGRAPHQLPRGRHGLTREQVAGAQRARMLRAIADAMSERGYVATTVADVIERAGTSRETFYQQFSSKQDCFLAAYEVAAAAILAELERQANSEGTPLERFERALDAYLTALAAEPEFARLFMVEVYSAGDDVLRRREEIQRRFTQLVIDGLGARNSAERFACEALVAAVITLVTARLAARDADGLRELKQPIVGLVAEALERIDRVGA
ncbi:MAG TPA: TetR/AcrR family transcriptional regulator [Solirubrobacteraceae bacterium]